MPSLIVVVEEKRDDGIMICHSHNFSPSRANTSINYRISCMLTERLTNDELIIRLKLNGIHLQLFVLQMIIEQSLY